MITKLQQWGNSQGIRIPKVILDEVKWNKDEDVVIVVCDEKLIIEKAKKKKNIKEIFEGYEEDYIPEEIDWGKKEGKERW